MTEKKLTLKQVIDKRCEQALVHAIAHFGNQNKLASAIGVSRQAVNLWCKNGKIGVSGAIALEEKFPAIFDKQNLRPDLF